MPTKLTDIVRDLSQRVRLFENASDYLGGVGRIDGIATLNLSAGGAASGGIFATAIINSQAHIYRLRAGTDAENSPAIIRPDDYAASTNEKVWELEGAVLQNVNVVGTLTLAADPSSALQAATKQYVDAVASGIVDTKASVRAATTANITLSGTQTIDGVALIVGDRVLVKNQTSTSDNGIYCLDEQTQILTAKGFKHYSELEQGELVLTFNLQTGLTEWQPLISVHSFQVFDEEMLSMEGPGHSSLSTLNHRWPVMRRRNMPKEQRGARRRDASGRYVKEDFSQGPFYTVRTSDQLNDADSLIDAAPCSNLPSGSKYQDAFVEMLAWFITEGHIRKNNSGHLSTVLRITQSQKVNPANVERIRNCLISLFGPATEVMKRAREGRWQPEWRERSMRSGMACFELNSIAGSLLCDEAPGKVPRPEFISSLTRGQLELFVQTCIAADGHIRKTDGSRTFIQKDARVLVAVQTACTLLGIATGISESNGVYTMSLNTRRFTQPHLRSKRIRFSGVVWCPKTANGTWVARRNNAVYCTGNTVAAGAWARSSDADSSAEVTAGMYVFVTEGSANDNTGWLLTTNDPIVLGTTGLVFAQFSGAGAISAGNGLVKVGSTLHFALSTAYATGAIPFATSGSLMGFDTANLFWDDGQNRLGLTINTPTHTLTLGSTSTGAAHYNTVDTTTNYERAVLKWVSNAFSVSMEKGGSGINRTFNVSGTYALGSGVQTAMSITPTISQSSTAGYTALLINSTESSLGSGANLLQDWQVGGASKASLDNAGRLSILNLVVGQAALSYAATVNIDFNAGAVQTLSLTGNVTFTTSNRGAGKSIIVEIVCDSTQRTLTFPAWVWLGVAPSAITASKTAILTLTCFGSNDTDIVAAYGEKDLTVTGNLSGLTSGGVLYATGANAAATDTTNFFWDATNKRLGLGTNAPGFQLHLNSAASPTIGQMKVSSNGLGAIGLLVYAADNVWLCFDADYTASAFTARNTSSYAIAKNAAFLSFYGNTGLSVGSGISYTELMRLTTAGLYVRGTVANPTAYLHLGAGTASASTAPLKFTSGPLLTAKEAGAVGYNNDYYHTRNGGTVRFGLGGCIFDHFADAGNTTTTETDLYSDSIPASTLDANGVKLIAEYGGVFVSSATATRQVKVYFGGSVIFDTGTLTLSLSAAWTCYVTIIRKDSATVRYMISFTTEGAALAAYTATGELGSLTLTNAQTLKITAQAASTGAATNDIVAKLGHVAILAPAA